MKYGIEFEYFIENEAGNIVPAFKYDKDLDGNPVIGELRTKVHDSIIDAVFELMKLVFIKEGELKKVGIKMRIHPVITVSNQFVKELRAIKEYMSRKHPEVLEELSIYPGNKLGKVLPLTMYKASLQINFSNNAQQPYRAAVRGDNGMRAEDKVFKYSQPFNYILPISKLDNAFSAEIRTADRVPGVYSIKDGVEGKRIEYRSLPNTVDLYKIIDILR